MFTFEGPQEPSSSSAKIECDPAVSVLVIAPLELEVPQVGAPLGKNEVKEPTDAPSIVTLVAPPVDLVV